MPTLWLHWNSKNMVLFYRQSLSIRFVKPSFISTVARSQATFQLLSNILSLPLNFRSTNATALGGQLQFTILSIVDSFRRYTHPTQDHGSFSTNLAGRNSPSADSSTPENPDSMIAALFAYNLMNRTIIYFSVPTTTVNNGEHHFSMEYTTNSLLFWILTYWI